MINESAQNILRIFENQFRNGRISQDYYNYVVADLKRDIAATEQELDQAFRHDPRRGELEKRKHEYYISR